MSAVSVGHSPTRWLPDSPHRRPPATTTTTTAARAVAAATVTTTKNPTTEMPVKTLLASQDLQENADNMEVGHSHGSRISFAPGTTFHYRTRLRSRGSSKKVSATFNLRPVTSREDAPKRKFQLPKATLPTLHYLSVSQEDFLDPRYAEDIVKTYGIPRYFFKSKSNLLLSSAARQRPQKTADGGSVEQTGQAVSEDKDTARMEKEAEDARPKTSEPSAFPRNSNRLPIVVPIATTSPDHRSQSAGMNGRDLAHDSEERGATPRNQLPQMASVYNPLIGEKYGNARFFPPMNPFRSLQMESEVTKYVEHKKRVGLGRYVRFAESNNNPTSAMLREATMYDLNRDGPADRPLDQFLPPPDRKLYSRQRPRDPKNDMVRPSDNRGLVIMPRERTATEKSTVILKDMVKR